MNWFKIVGLTFFALALLLCSTAPFASADSSYDMTTYIQGYLSSRVPDDRINPWNDDIFRDGRQITNALAPQVVFSGVVSGNASNYTEVERLAAYAETSGDNANGQVSAKMVRAGYEVSFMPAISASNGVGTRIYFLGNYWTIEALNGFTSSGCSNCSVSLVLTSQIPYVHLLLINGASLPSTWRVSLLAEGAALKKIVVSDVNSVPSLAVGQAMNIAGAAGNPLNSHKLVFDGIDSVSHDTLRFRADYSSLPMSATDTETRGNIVGIMSNAANAFGNSVGSNLPVNAIYFVVGNAGGNATVGDIFYLYGGYFRRFVHPQGGGGINFVDYQYKPNESVRISFNANNAQQNTPPDYNQFVIAIPEYVTEPSNQNEQGGWFIDVGYANSINGSPTLFRNDTLVGYSPDEYSVAQPHQDVALYDPGFVSDRGGIMQLTGVGLTAASLSYALSLAHAKYSLVKLAGSNVTPTPPAPSPSPSPSPTYYPSPSPTIRPNSCNDTDGGQNYFVRGTVSGYLNGLKYSYTDYCLSKQTLLEYSCKGSIRSQSVNYSCSSGCVNGACSKFTAAKAEAAAPPQLGDWTTPALVLVLFAAIVSTGYFWRARSMKK
ncbi:MAG: hypothetical protein V1817_04745 [Candidatus Micrarchaeota archaeon]